MGDANIWDGTQWVPMGGGGGAAVDWANVPSPIVIKNPEASGPAISHQPNAKAYPVLILSDNGGSGSYSVKTGNGTYDPMTRWSFGAGAFILDNGTLDIPASGQAIRFRAVSSNDTILKAGTTAGVLTINDKDIQVAATARDGSEVGLQALLDQVEQLKAEVAELRARLGGG